MIPNSLNAGFLFHASTRSVEQRTRVSFIQALSFESSVNIWTHLCQFEGSMNFAEQIVQKTVMFLKSAHL